MKKILLPIFFYFLFLSSTNAQYSLVLQPDATSGKDTYIDSRLNSTNFGTHVDFAGIAWTNGGTPTSCRGLIEFDLTSIPSTATITSAYLSLYSYNSPYNGSHSTLNGPNDCVLQRITSSWNENTVTWDTQPTTTTLNQVTLATSTSSIQNYPNIDVTNMVKDMHANPSSNFGFLLKLNTESYYRRMIFGSSDNTDPNLRPKLVVNYTPIDVGIKEQESRNDLLNIFPNPSKDYFTIQLQDKTIGNYSVEITDNLGQVVLKMNAVNGETVELKGLNMANGIYCIYIKTSNKQYSKKLIIN